MARIVFIGNCQAQMLEGAYRYGPAADRDDTTAYIMSYQPLTQEGVEAIAAADAVVFQVTDGAQQVTLKDVPPHKRLVLFPMIAGIYLWPYADGTHPMDDQIPQGYLRPFSGLYGDRWLDAEIKAGRSDIVARYRDLNIVGDRSVPRLFELAHAKQRERDRQCSTTFTDFIEAGMQDAAMFLHIYHPSPTLAHEMIRVVLSRLECSDAQIAAVTQLTNVGFVTAELPIHPQIASHFDLRWARPDYKYLFAFDERVTWDAWCHRYVAHDWGRDLQDAIREGDAESLMRLSAVHDSGAGYYAAAMAYHRAGRPTEALAAVGAAIRSQGAWPYHVLHATLLAETGALDEAISVAANISARTVATGEPQRLLDHLLRCRENVALKTAPG